MHKQSHNTDIYIVIFRFPLTKALIGTYTKYHTGKTLHHFKTLQISFIWDISCQLRGWQSFGINCCNSLSSLFGNYTMWTYMNQGSLRLIRIRHFQYTPGQIWRESYSDLASFNYVVWLDSPVSYRDTYPVE